MNKRSVKTWLDSFSLKVGDIIELRTLFLSYELFPIQVLVIPASKEDKVHPHAKKYASIDRILLGIFDNANLSYQKLWYVQHRTAWIKFFSIHYHFCEMSTNETELNLGNLDNQRFCHELKVYGKNEQYVWKTFLWTSNFIYATAPGVRICSISSSKLFHSCNPLHGLI